MLYRLISSSAHGKRTLSQTSQRVLIRKNFLRLTIATHPLCLKVLLTKTGSLGVSISCMLVTESSPKFVLPQFFTFGIPVGSSVIKILFIFAIHTFAFWVSMVSSPLVFCLVDKIHSTGLTCLTPLLFRFLMRCFVKFR